MSKITPESIAVFGLASATAHKKLALLTPEQWHDLAYEALFYAAVAQELYDRTPQDQRNEYAQGYLTATQDILSALATPTALLPTSNIQHSTSNIQPPHSASPRISI